MFFGLIIIKASIKLHTLAVKVLVSFHYSKASYTTMYFDTFIHT